MKHRKVPKVHVVHEHVVISTHYYIQLTCNMCQVYERQNMNFKRSPTHPSKNFQRFFIDSILPFLGLEGTNCDVNEVVMPIQTGPNVHICPSSETCNDKWSPWDKNLTPERHTHLLVTDPALFQRIRRGLTVEQAEAMSDYAARLIASSCSYLPQRTQTTTWSHFAKSIC